MAAADYRLMTEATGQRIAAALEALHLATVTGVKGNNEANYRHGDVNITPENIGAAKADAEFHNAIGNIVASASRGTAVGYGMAFVSVRGKAVTVEFEAQIITAGSVSDVYDVGISVDTLRTINSTIPNFTPLDGFISYYKPSGELDTNLQGYAGIGRAVNNRWNFARIFNTSGGIGPWADSIFRSTGTYIMGTIYGVLT